MYFFVMLAIYILTWNTKESISLFKEYMYVSKECLNDLEDWNNKYRATMILLMYKCFGNALWKNNAIWKKLRTLIFFLSALNGIKLTHFDKLLFKVCYEGKSICLIIETLDALWKICINHKFWEGILPLIFPSQTYGTCNQQTRINVKERKRGYKIISFCCKSNTVILKKWDGQTKVSPMIC